MVVSGCAGAAWAVRRVSIGRPSLAVLFGLPVEVVVLVWKPIAVRVVMVSAWCGGCHVGSLGEEGRWRVWLDPFVGL